MANEKRLYRSVMKVLEQLINEGEYPPGGRLPPERELAERLKVSRPTVREAIIALEALEKVEVKTGSGVYVLDTPKRSKGIDATVSAFEFTEARALIEGEAAALAATMISDEQLAELETSLYDMANETADGELVSEMMDEKFHRTISEATQNSMMVSVFDNLWHIRNNAPQVHAAYQAICEVEPQSRVEEHKEILESLKRRDPKAAREAMHNHFGRILSKLIVANEESQVEEIRRKTKESRARFSLNHLATGA
ncbi:MAG: FadR/GntR family transcriptional regulator [Woeseiaceae bacterium]